MTLAKTKWRRGEEAHYELKHIHMQEQPFSCTDLNRSIDRRSNCHFCETSQGLWKGLFPHRPHVDFLGISRIFCKDLCYFEFYTTETPNTILKYVSVNHSIDLNI